MKISLFFSVFSVVALALFAIWAKNQFDRHNTAISVSEDRQSYVFTASYDPVKTTAVENYINQNIIPDKLGGATGDDVDVTTTLVDRTHFYIRESRGKLKIAFDKRENTTASYKRIRNICNGIKQLLAGNAARPETAK